MEAKDLNKVAVEVKVNGTSCDFSHLELRQTMFGHHVFIIHLNYRTKEEEIITGLNLGRTEPSVTANNVIGVVADKRVNHLSSSGNWRKINAIV
ncbi:hypothetical protein [Bacteroides sp.]